MSESTGNGISTEHMGVGVFVVGLALVGMSVLQILYFDARETTIWAIVLIVGAGAVWLGEHLYTSARRNK